MSDTNTSQTPPDGAALAIDGMIRASERRERQMVELQIAFLRALLARPGASLTVEDVTSNERMKTAYSDNGKWVGSAISQLSAERIIAHICDSQGRLLVKRSKRVSRHAGPVYLWQLVSIAEAQACLNRLLLVLANMPDMDDEPSQGTLFDDEPQEQEQGRATQ